MFSHNIIPNTLITGLVVTLITGIVTGHKVDTHLEKANERMGKGNYKFEKAGSIIKADSPVEVVGGFGLLKKQLDDSGFKNTCNSEIRDLKLKISREGNVFEIGGTDEITQNCMRVISDALEFIRFKAARRNFEPVASTVRISLDDL